MNVTMDPIYFGRAPTAWDRRLWKGGGGSSAPAPDPNIGIAALKEAQVAERMANIAEEELKWNRERYEEVAPLLKELQSQQVEVGRRGLERDTEFWDRYKSIYVPNEEKYAKAVDEFDTTARRELEAGKAIADVSTAFDAQDANRRRLMQSYGINPASGRFGDEELRSGIARAAAGAGAANVARNRTEMQGLALREGLANFGRGLPAQAAQSTGLALSGSGAGQAGIAQQTASRNAGVGATGAWFSGAQQGYGKQADILNMDYRNRLAAWQTEQDMAARESSGFGSLLGTVAGGAIGWFAGGGPAGALAGASIGSRLFSK